MQSNAKTPAYLNQRYQQFYSLAFDKLKKLSAEDFAQYKNAIITEMKQPPQTFYEEVGRYSSDFTRNIFTFDTREKIIKTLESTTQQQIIDFYKNAIIQRKGMSLASQVIGKDEKPQEYAELPGWTIYKTTSQLQQMLPIEEDAK